MRITLTALSVILMLGVAAPAAIAGEGCSYSGHEAKANDFETPPPPAAATVKPKTQG